jgi:hypothetical protein
MPSLPAPAVARLLGGAPAELELLAGGRNSRVYRVADAAGETFALKHYFRHPGDPRDRLGAEQAALGFLWDHGVACVPRPLGADPEAGLGLYEFIAGTRPLDPTAAEVDQAAAFLVQLHRLGLQPGAERLLPASEARFSLEAVADNVRSRLLALAAVPALAGFLDGELVPAWEAALTRCMAGCRRLGLPFERELAPGERTLSPSDFGFHNALRRDGRLVFLDFEYFGWDDPAKLVADLLLHPGMQLPAGLRLRLAEGLLAGFPDPAALRRRVRLAYPLFGIKWCLIMLNEFLPGDLERRRFAQPEAGSARERQARQLEKTRQKLHWIRDDHDPFTPAP